MRREAVGGCRCGKSTTWDLQIAAGVPAVHSFRATPHDGFGISARKCGGPDGFLAGCPLAAG